MPLKEARAYMKERMSRSKAFWKEREEGKGYAKQWKA